MGSEPVAAELIAAAHAVAWSSRAVERSLGDMTLPQFRVLDLIATSPERASRIAERAAISRPSLTGVLDGLEQRGWVRRVDVEGDRRGVGLEVTASGRRALVAAERDAAGAIATLLDAAEPAVRQQARDGLQALGASLRAAREQRAVPS